MKLGQVTALRRGAAVLAALVLAAGIAVPADGRDATRERNPGARRTSPFNLGASSTFLMNFNEWLCGIQQIGEVCTSAVGSSVGGGGFWPAGTANQYIFNSGLQIAAIVGPNGGAWAGDTLATFFFNASGNGAGAPWAPIYASNRPEDIANWPEDCHIDSPVYGRVKTLSELDTCVQYWDGDPGASHFADSHPMGILVTQHSMLWSFPNNKDILFFSYKFTNVTDRPEFLQRNPQAPAGGYTLTDIYAAFAMDPDVSGNEYSENFATVVPELNMATSWQYDFEASDFVAYAPNFDAAPGFVGVKYLKSPVNTSDTTMTIRVGAEVRDVAPGEELGLTFFSVFTNGGIMSDARNAKQAFRYLSGQLLETERSQWCPSAPPGMCYVNLAGPADMRFYQSSGPFKLEPGESAEIVVAYMAGAPVPGTYTKGVVIPVGSVTDTTRAIERVMGRGYDVVGFPSLFANAKTAQAIYDANFILPSAPPSPAITVIPGDRQNTVIWDAAPVNHVDPYYTIASDPENALYDPLFRANDFEGFRIYRKSNPAAEWTLIGQFDLKNGLDEQVTVLERVTTIDGSELIIKADTARVCTATGCSAETGLQFALIDRGGAFPNPASGPGLTNGVRYYYAVTSFDINSPISGPSSLESARVLDAGNTGTPRGLGAGRTAARTGARRLLDATGAALDVNRGVGFDANTGTFDGPQPPTNGFQASFVPFDELLIKPGDMEVRIDSIVPLNDIGLVFPGGHEQTVANALGVSVAYFMTVTTPDTTFAVREEVVAPFGHFGAPEQIDVDAVSAPVGADRARARQLGVDSTHYAGAFGVKLNYGPDDLSSGAEAVSAFRTGQVATVGGSRWFVGAEPTRVGTSETDAGTLPGVTQIVNTSHQYLQNANLRWLTYLLSPVMRAVDYEITWGAGGEIVQVMDRTHNVEVPFSEAYRGSWGVRNEVSGDGILSFGDFWLTTPVAEWYCEVEGCDEPLSRTAVIQPLSTVPPAGYNLDVGAADGEGFGLYIAGELFLFETSTLPAAGTVWTLRTYGGEIRYDEDAGLFSFRATNLEDYPALRPPTVTGLRAVVTVEAPTSYNVAAADLSRVHTVPDPYYVTNKLENSFQEKKLLFVNLPPKAVVRIYSLSGVLVAALDHDDPLGGGQLEWDLRNRNNQFVASGVYFYHVEAPGGQRKVGKFTVVQYAQ